MWIFFSFMRQNKSADQLCGNSADMRLCFCICNNQIFSRGGSDVHFEPAYEILAFIAYASNDGSGETVHVAGAFVVYACRGCK